MAGSHITAMDWQYHSLTTDNPVGIDESHSIAPCWNIVQQRRYDHQGMATAPLEMPVPYQNTTTSTKAKRKPKAPTMSAEKWEPCKMRIKELYIDKRKTLKDVRMIVNKEFELSATERQYKVQIENWNLERNVKKDERRAIVKKVCYRKQKLRKETGLIRVRGHKVTEKLERWMREMGIQMTYDHIPTSPPPDTPSEVSFHTTSHPGSPLILSPSPKLGLGDFSVPLDHGVKSTAVISNLCRYARMSDSSFFHQNDTHTLLRCLAVILNYSPSKPPPKDVQLYHKLDYDQWNSSTATDVRLLRSLIESAQDLTDRNLNILIAPVLRYTLVTAFEKGSTTYTSTLRTTSWLTPHGRTDASFRLTSRKLRGSTEGSSGDTTTDELIAAKVAIIPSQVISPFRIEFAFDVSNSYFSHCLNAIRISYQPIVPQDSRILHIAQHGTVEELKKALLNGTASLNDHDPEGRPLLSYALKKPNLDMCKFLLCEGADPNAYAPTEDGFIDPVSNAPFFFQGEKYPDNKQVSIASAGVKLLLEAGADLSLPDDAGKPIFAEQIYGVARSTFEAMLNLGGPFISPNMLTNHAEQQSTVMTITGVVDCTNMRDAAEKIIVLIRRGVDLSFRDKYGSTALHYLFEWSLQIDSHPDTEGWLEYYRHKVRDLIDVALILITAGSDVYAANNFGQTPTQNANGYGLKQLWIRCLEFSGYDSDHVLAHPHGILRDCPDTKRDLHIMTLEEYCELRTEHGFTFHEWVSEMEADMLKRARERKRKRLERRRERRQRDIDETDSDETDDSETDDDESDVDELNTNEADVDMAAAVTNSAMEFENNPMDNELNSSLADGTEDIGETVLDGGYDEPEESDSAIQFGDNQQSLDWAMQWQNWL